MIGTEMKLLCTCLRWPLTSDAVDKIKKAAEGAIDWDKIGRLAARHRVGGLVASALFQADVALPHAARSRFKNELASAGYSELRSAAEAKALLGRLRDAGIGARLIKGPAAAIMAFGRLGLRINRDIDLLVAPSDVDAAVLILIASGYGRVEPAADASPAAVARWRRTHKDLVFLNEKNMIVELHWRLFDNPSLLEIDQNRFAGRAEAGPFAFETFSPEFTAVYLAVHGAQHAWSRLKWLADLNALVGKFDKDALDRTIALAKQHRVWPSLGQALILCSRYLGLDLPVDLQRQLVRSSRLRVLTWIGERAAFGGDGAELEAQPFGSTFKNISHYMIASGVRYWAAEVRFDAFDMSSSGLPERIQRLGPLARPVGWFWKRRSLRGG